MARRRTTTFSADAPSDGSDWRGALGRFGIAARGVLYLALGALALQFAFGDGSGQQVSDRGAIAFVQSQPFGTVLLWVLALGLVSLALWQFTTAVTGDPVEGSEASDRATYAIKGVLYAATAAVAFGALGVAASQGGGGSSGGGGGQSQAAAYLLDLPYGQWIAGAIGVAVVAYGLRTLWQHAKEAEFMQRITSRRLDAGGRDAVRAAGRAGYGARGVIIAVVGVFFVIAALQHSPDQTRGLAGALVALSRQPHGQWILTAVAAGLLLYGVFSLVEAAYRRAA